MSKQTEGDSVEDDSERNLQLSEISTHMESEFQVSELSNSIDSTEKADEARTESVKQSVKAPKKKKNKKKISSEKKVEEISERETCKIM